jgi:hypothetical protein
MPAQAGIQSRREAFLDAPFAGMTRDSVGVAPTVHLAQILTTPGAPHIAQGEKLKR